LFKEELKPENWISLQNKEGIEIFRYAGKEEGSGVKAITEFEATPKQIMDYIAIPGVIEKAGTMIELLNVFDKIDDDNVYYYMKLKSMMIVAARDFVGISRNFIDTERNK
jgi:hypothetical protein